MRRWLGVLFAAGAVLGFLGTVAPGTGGDIAAQRLVSLAALPPAVVLLAGPWRLPPVAYHLLLAYGAVIVTLGSAVADPEVAGTVALFYVWVSLYAFSFFTPAAASAHVGVIAVLYGTMLVDQHRSAALAQWVQVVGSVAVAGYVVGSLSREVRSLARRDPLTGLDNRRAFEEWLDWQVALARRSGEPLCVAILDLDGFKEVNDSGGHRKGDRVLVDIARAWRRDVRAADRLARWGGDEFALVASGATEQDVTRTLDRLRGATSAVGFSSGVARWSPGESPEHLVDRADHALYEAKQVGRGRCVVSLPPSSAGARG
jgi:diguanylate cyclase (GGDEF)-like protein